MKKTVLYIIVFLLGIIIGSLFFINKSELFSKAGVEQNEYMASRVSAEDRTRDFVQSASRMLGESIIINGNIQEVYKNRDNEVVLYLKDQNIPIIVNCTLLGSDLQITEPFRIGENINLQGIFTQLNEKMYLESCRLIYRAPRER